MSVLGSFEEFVEFVNEQDPERVINHENGWAGCSVGDYFEEAVDLHRTTATRMVYYLFNEHEEIMILLGDDYHFIPTYGDLAICLNEYVKRKAA